jgi:DNA polymerase-1
MVDPVTLSWVEVSLLTRKDEAERLLEKAGFLRDGSVNQTAVKDAVVAACEKLGKPIPRTEPTEKMKAKGKTEGNIRMNAETLEELASGLKAEGIESDLVSLTELGHTNKILSTYIAPMKGGTVHPMNSRPNVLVNSGRISWGGGTLKEYNPWWPEGVEGQELTNGTNLTNFPKEEGVRECIVARPGTWLSSTDYSALELRTFAQAALWVVGYSTFADGFSKDPDWDPHCYFAGHLTKRTYEDAVKLHKAKDPDFAKVRQIAKNLNFSLIGGVGPKKFQWMAKQAEIDLTLDQCYFYKNEWLEAFPETKGYFDYISWLSSNSKSLKQFVTKRIRGDVGYCDGANSFFQGLGGDIAKYAMFLVSMASYAEPKSPLFNSRPLVLVHDEIVAEHPIEGAHEANMEVVRLMNRAFEEFCPDVPSRAEPTLMTRWIKNAKPRFEKGRLSAWDS